VHDFFVIHSRRSLQGYYSQLTLCQDAQAIVICGSKGRMITPCRILTLPMTHIQQADSNASACMLQFKRCTNAQPSCLNVTDTRVLQRMSVTIC
jgi:hypothetical protein